MRTRTRHLLQGVVALAFFFPLSAEAGFVSGRDLLGSCRPEGADPVYRLKVAECRGYVLAIADSTDCGRRQLEFRSDSASATSQRELVEQVVGWLQGHPDVLDYQADGLVAAALSKAYPCSPLTAQD